jgi:hypothetical protein
MYVVRNLNIIVGHLIDIHEFPHVVSLRFYSSEQFLFAGCIVTDKHVLTACHCVHDLWDFLDLRLAEVTCYEYKKNNIAI